MLFTDPPTMSSKRRREQLGILIRNLPPRSSGKPHNELVCTELYLHESFKQYVTAVVALKTISRHNLTNIL